jgi:hypothetical protein
VEEGTLMEEDAVANVEDDDEVDVEDGGRDEVDAGGGRGGGARPDASADDGREARDGGRANANCAATLTLGGSKELTAAVADGRVSDDAAEGGSMLETEEMDDEDEDADEGALTAAPTNRKSSSRCCGADADIGNICSSRGSSPLPPFFLAACEKLATNSWICARRKSRCSDDSVNSPEERDEEEADSRAEEEENADADDDDVGNDAAEPRAAAESSARRATAHSFSVTRSRYSARIAFSDSSSD